MDAGEDHGTFSICQDHGFSYVAKKNNPQKIEFATYKVVNRKEFCECSLTAGSFQLDETLVKCTPEINSEADGRFKSYFAINKIIFDYLQAEKRCAAGQYSGPGLKQAPRCKNRSMIGTPLNWYVNPDLPDHGPSINSHLSVIADLMGVMDHIITEGEEEAYQSEIQYRNAQSEFK